MGSTRGRCPRATGCAALASLAVEDGKAESEEAAAAWLVEDTDEVREYLFGIEAEHLTELMSDAGIRMSNFPHLFGDDSAEQIEGPGSFHGIFVPMLGGHNYDAMYDFSEAGYQDMASQFMGYLGNFLRGADISSGADVTWPAWTVDERQTRERDGKARPHVLRPGFVPRGAWLSF